MPPRNKNSQGHSKSAFLPQDQDLYEGERLDRLLQQIQRRIESTRLEDGKSLPEKIWFKKLFAIGVNDVTRVLERMPPTARASSLAGKAACIELQAVVIAYDCNPRWLSKHLPSLALSRKVPVIFLKDNKGASLRLGQLFKLKTAIAIGVKAKGNAINLLFEEILSGNTMQLGVGSECLNSSQMLTTTQGKVQR
ncbi:hypothetical protein FF1_047289 [Malus domestica]|uniref:Ribosomal protein eL8/eL30/eS12/Gadd45 domain-containing protein n=1 Tax=Malus baccata TaxID=106549 RepID=A0A540NKH9_MALBA|nr:uncharacterized protein LOC103444477 [Malus domestica]TQE11538.1 hypothetical protein C1H46_002913 [Malus baccata]